MEGSVPVAEVEWVAGAFARLKEVAQLPDNWDDRGSPRMDPAIVAAAASLLWRLRDTVRDDVPCPDVCPIAGGSLQFEWTLGGKHLEIEFVDSENVLVLQEEVDDGGPTHRTVELPLQRLSRIRKLLDWLVSP